MRKSLCLLAMSTILCSAIGCGQKGGQTVDNKEIDVVLISGQSNAVGNTWVDELTDTVGFQRWEEFLDGYPGVQIAYDNWTKDAPNGDWNNGPFSYFSQSSSGGKFVKVKLGEGKSTDHFGPEIGIAEELHERHENKLYLIKYAAGATNLKNDWCGRNSKMYPLFIQFVKNQINNLKSKGFKPTIKAFCWMQGEGDAWDGYWNVYQDNLRTFVGDVREDLKEYAGNKDIPFIDAGISNAPDWPKYQQVNAAKAAFAAESENNFYIDTIAAGMHTNKEPYGHVDTAHYDSDSEVLLGHLFAQAFEQFLISEK